MVIIQLVKVWQNFLRQLKKNNHKNIFITSIRPLTTFCTYRACTYTPQKAIKIVVLAFDYAKEWFILRRLGSGALIL